VPFGGDAVSLLSRLIGPIWQAVQGLLRLEKRRTKLYRELTATYEHVVVILRNIAATPAMEIDLMTNIGHSTSVPFYRHCKEDIDTFTDLVDHRELDNVYGRFLGITTAAVPDRLLHAKFAVFTFEDGFLSGRLNQELVLRVASGRVKEGLEIVRRGDWKSLVDRTPNDAAPPVN